MSLADSVEAALAAGSATMLEAMGVEMEVYDPRTQTTYTVTGHFEALREAAQLESGGFEFTHGGDAWWARTETAEPEIGWLVKLSGRVLRVREVVDDPLDADWEVKLEAV